MMNKVKEVNVYENYELEDSKFRIKVNSFNNNCLYFASHYSIISSPKCH